MEFKHSNQDFEKENKYFSSEKDFMDKENVVKSIDNDLNNIEDKTNKIHSMNISFDLGSQKELAKRVSDKDIKSINDLSKKEMVDYDKVMQDHIKAIMEEYNFENSERSLEYYGKVSSDKEHSNSTNVNLILVDKNEKGINQEGMREIVNSRFENEIGVKSHTGIEKDSQYDYNKLMFDREGLSQDTKANKDLYRLKSYIDDKNPKQQEALLSNYSKMNNEEKKDYLDKMERQRMNRDYLSILKEDSKDFEDGLGFDDNTPSFEDFKQDWKQNFEEEKGIVNEIKDLGLEM